MQDLPSFGLLLPGSLTDRVDAAWSLGIRIHKYNIFAGGQAEFDDCHI